MQKVRRWLRLIKGWMWVMLLAALGVVLAAPGVALGRAANRAWLEGEVVYGQPLQVSSQMVEGSWDDTQNSAQPAGGSPLASLPESFYDFGEMDAASQVTHDFYLRNQGSAPLIIRQAYTTCGCTTAEISASVIPPGKAARIAITFDGGFHRIENVTVRRGLILETSDPLHPQLELWVQARIQ